MIRASYITLSSTGSSFYITVKAEASDCSIIVSDNGKGAEDEQMDKLNHAPHYMVCDENTAEQRHGLGLLIVKQIISVHGGTTVVGHSLQGGFMVKLTLPIQEPVTDK